MITSVLIIIYICITLAVAATLFVGGATGELQEYVESKQKNSTNLIIACISVVIFWPIIAVYSIFKTIRGKK